MGEVATDLRGLANQLTGALAEIEHLGDLESLAGDAAALHAASAAWREMASDLRDLAIGVQGDAARVLAAWLEPASDAFHQSWASAEAKIGDLAAGCDRAAAALDESASQQARLRDQLLSAVAVARSMVTTLQGMANPAGMLDASQRVPDQISQLRDLIRSIDLAWLTLLNALLALTLLFEHLMSRVHAADLQPATRGPKPSIRPGAQTVHGHYGAGIEVTWPAPGMDVPASSPDPGAIAKTLAVAAAAVGAAGTAGAGAGLLQSNQTENDQARRAADKAGLNRKGRSALHREISKKGYSQQEIDGIAQELYDNFPKYRK